MTLRPDLLAGVAAALSDRAPIDWAAAESSAGSDAEREQIRNLRLIGRLADAHTAASLAGDQAALHESLLNPVAGHGCADDDPAPVQWGPLHVIEKIGRGRFGDVYRARDPRLDRDVALKLLRRRASGRDGVGSHVIEEGRLLAKVRHPNVVTVYGAERIDDRVGVWMELVRGRTLEQEVADRRALPAADVAAIGVDVCRALAAVHRAGLVHRDVKAQNVMRDEDGRLVLMDFGTGSERDAASPDELAGTPLYLAPEVLAGASATAQSDLYSAGVLLFHLGTGGFPVRGRSLTEIRQAHARGERATGPNDAGALPPPLAPVVERALASDPGRRYASAEEMAAALDASVAAAAANPVPVRRLTSRRFGLVAAMLVVVVATLVLAAASGWRRFWPGAASAGAAPTELASRRVWSGVGVDGSGSPSPDGAFLSFTDWETGDLAVRDLTNGTSRRLTHTGGWGPSGDYATRSVFSRDGRQLAVAWLVETPPAFELRIVPFAASGGAPTRTAMRTPVTDFVAPVAWTADGTAIIVRRHTPDASEVGRVTVKDGSYHTLIPLGWRRPTNFGIGLSPDGRFIAYDAPAGDRGSPADIYLAAADGGVPVPVVQSVARDESPVWSPDGSHLLFMSDRTGTMSLWTQPMREGRPAGPPALLRADMDGVALAGITNNGALYYFVSGAARQNVYVTDLVGFTAASAPSLVSDRFVNSNIGPAWSHDGERIAYYSRRPDPKLVVRMTASGEERDYALPATLAIPFHEGPRWFPDNDSLLVMTRHGQNGRAFQRLSLSSGVLEELARPTHGNLSSYALAPDGSAIVYAHQQFGQAGPPSGQLVRLDLSTKQETILGRNRWFITVAFSPDGRELAYVESIRPDDKQATRTLIGVMPSQGGPAREIFSDPTWLSAHRYNSLGWSADGRSVVFVGEDGALRGVPAAGGAVETMGISMTPRIKTPVFHPDGRRLAFGTVDADTNEVWVLENFLPAFEVARNEPAPRPPASSAAMSLEQVWAGFGANTEGQPSADGRSLVFVDWPSNGNLGIRDLVSGTNRLLTRGGDYRTGANAASPVLSPDGRSVAYLWDTNPVSLRVIGLDGAAPRTIYRRERMVPYPVGWTPDGRHLALALINLRDHTGPLAMIPAAGGSVTTIKEMGSRDWEFGGFSPDGQWALYAVRHGANDKNGGIFILRLSDRTERPLVQTPGRDYAPRWTPDGRAIVFLSDRTGTTDLWWLRVTDGRGDEAPELLRRSVGNIDPMAFTRDGTYFYGASNFQSDAYVAELDPSTLAVTRQPRRLTDRFQGSNFGPAWSPDGKRVAFMRGERTSSAIVIHDVDGGERTLPTKVTDGFAASRHGLNWFPDGRSLLLQDWVGQKKPFRKIDVETGESQTLFEPDQHTWFAIRLSPDGRLVYYSAWESARAVQERAPLRLFRRDIGTGRIDLLYETTSDGIGAFGLCVSPDGRTLAFSVNEAPGVRLLMTLPAGGGEPRVLLRGSYQNPVPAPMTWTRDGKHLLYVSTVSRDGEPRREMVWAIPAEGGAPRRLDIEMASFLSLTFSPDGRRLAFQSGRSAQEVWAIRNLLTGARPSRR